MGALRVERWGDGGRAVVLVHGSVAGGSWAWSEQRPLAERHTLLVVDRPGFADGSPIEAVDFEVDAELVAELLESTPSHLVGHSYGGVVSLLAAARRPGAVHSLAVIEPPAFGVAAASWASGDRGRPRSRWRSC
jgi:pimeloyl-ACP methyl ester carboxylesterase